ncbi:hypothetical protein [Rhodobacter sp. CZR27]|uniref:hypothetical protein n=1 Tax=Rhodobacter sp. CZR27 TaxID=2033869 RepID=UPI000BBEB2FA|nr:hypothetical protein [Rhodobacter sp. CZR27]
MERVRKLATAAVSVTLALAAGQYMETSASRPPSDEIRPTHVQPVSAGPDDRLTLSLATPLHRSLPVDPALVILPEEQTAPHPMRAEVQGSSCRMALTLRAEPAAILALDLAASCRPDERVVLRHAGLAVTGRTSASGHLQMRLPALSADGRISVLFADGGVIEAAQPVADLAGLRRIGVQWLGDDAFQMHAFEAGARHGEPGHVSAVDPKRASARGGFLSLLGEAGVSLPMQAEIYTHPGDGTPASVEIEAAVTPQTCGRTLIGEVLDSAAGRVETRELTLEMPGCDAVGDYIVLKNLSPDLNMASAR